METEVVWWQGLLADPAEFGKPPFGLAAFTLLVFRTEPTVATRGHGSGPS
jgi:hypothetical protein